MQGSPTLHRSGRRDGHTLALIIQSQYLGMQWMCPHQGTDFASIETAPACRIGMYEDGIESVSRTCVPGEHFAELREEAFVLENEFMVASLPVNVEWWFELVGCDNEFCVRPYRPEAADPARVATGESAR